MNNEQRKRHFNLFYNGIVKENPDKLKLARNLRKKELNGIKYLCIYRKPEYIRDHLEDDLMTGFYDIHLSEPIRFDTDNQDCKLPFECYQHVIGKKIVMELIPTLIEKSLPIDKLMLVSVRIQNETMNIKDENEFFWTVQEICNQHGIHFSDDYMNAIKERINNFLTKIQENDLKCLGVRCFTDRENNSELWSKHADDSKGICICIPTEAIIKDFHTGYDTVSPLDYLFPVFYSNSQRETLANEILSRNYLETSKELLAAYNMVNAMIKREDYEFEYEWRFVMGFPKISDNSVTGDGCIDAYNNHDMVFPIEKIVLGSNISQDDEKKVIQSVKKLNENQSTRKILIYKNNILINS